MQAKWKTPLCVITVYIVKKKNTDYEWNHCSPGRCPGNAQDCIPSSATAVTMYNDLEILKGENIRHLLPL